MNRTKTMTDQWILKAVFAGILAASLPFSAAAQQSGGVSYSDQGYGPQQGDWELTLGGQGSNDKDFDAGSFGASGTLGYFVTDSWELALRQQVSFADSDTAGSRWNGSSRGAIDYHFDFERVQPFVGANFGYRYGDDTEESFLAGLEAGLKYYVKPKTFIFARGEYGWIFDDADEAEDTFDDGRFLYALGIGFNF